MIHIGTVNLNGREYTLDLKRTDPPRSDSAAEVTGTGPRRNLPTTRSEIHLLNVNRKPSQHPDRPIATIRAIEDFRRLTHAAPRDQAVARVIRPKWRTDHEAVVNLVSRFLTWCFPVREFKSPLQRVLYLSMEGPKAKYRRRFLLR